MVKRNCFNLVPNEIINNVLDFCDDEDIMMFTSTCERFFYFDQRKKSGIKFWHSRKAAVYEIPEIIIDIEERSLPYDDEIAEAQRWLVESGYKLQRGDLIYFESAGYNYNDGLCIYDGKKIIKLVFEIDNYGHVPNNFSVITEFPLQYWKGLIHSKLVPVSQHLSEILLKNLSTINIRINLDISSKLSVSGDVPYSFIETEFGKFHFLFIQLNVIYVTNIIPEIPKGDLESILRKTKYYYLLDEINKDYMVINTKDKEDFNNKNTLVLKLGFLEKCTHLTPGNYKGYVITNDKIYININGNISILPNTHMNRNTLINF